LSATLHTVNLNRPIDAPDQAYCRTAR
jgi:hypothetical protein